jgi:hypothetical protein
MEAVQVFDLQNNEILNFPFNEDQAAVESATVENAIVESPIAADASQSYVAGAELSPPAQRPRPSWLVLALVAVILVETTYLGIQFVLERVPVAPAAVIAPPDSPTLRQPAVAPAIAMDAASTVGSVGDVRLQALEGAIAAAPPRPLPPPPPPVPVEPPGGISMTLPIQVQIFEGGRYVGTNDRERIPLSAGRHQLELVNESLGYRSTETVNVPSGKVVPVAVPLPSGTLNINAQPWGDVLIDNEPAGQTPLGNVRLPIGPHEIVFRHPQFGTQTRTVVVSLGAPTRVAVDLRR